MQKINTMVETGKYAELEIEKIIMQGAYLLAGDDTTPILLPTKYIPEGVDVGDHVKVFIYRDSDDRIIATTQEPYAIVGEFAYLKVKTLSNFGAFLDWGLVKDLMVPFSEQVDRMETGKSYVVRLYLDEKTDRIVATTYLNRFLRENDPQLTAGDEVNILVCDEAMQGFKVIVENKYWGMIFKNQIFTDIQTGQKLKAYVKNVRDDGKIDVTLQQPGYKEILSAEEKILKLLTENGGHSDLCDKSLPDEIYSELQMSKKVFKKALGFLFRYKKIELLEDGIKLTKLAILQAKEEIDEDID